MNTQCTRHGRSVLFLACGRQDLPAHSLRAVRGYSRETSHTESTSLVCRHATDVTLLNAVGGDMERYCSVE
jgi:hypothetical protein